MALNFRLPLAWSQLSVFDESLTDPFNDWTAAHLSQGFSWRPGSVSFRLPIRAGAVDVTVDFVDSLELFDQSRWAIVVPFHTWGGRVEVSTITESQVIELPAGAFSLLYQTGIRDDGTAWAHLGVFDSHGTAIEPRVLRGDDLVHADGELLMQAEPAA